MEECEPDDNTDVLSLSLYSEWHDSTASGTDLEEADLIVLDEVGFLEKPQRQLAHLLGPLSLLVSVTMLTKVQASKRRVNCALVRKLKTRIFKSKERECPVCGLATREKITRHIMKKHLPWFWSGTTACWDCKKQELQDSSPYTPPHK